MEAKIEKTIGNTKYAFTIEATKGFDVLFMAGFLAAMPIECKLCKSKNIHLASNKAKGYSFVKMICDDCNGRAQVGQYKDGGYYWKEWEKYIAPSQQTTQENAPLQQVAPPEDNIDPSDIPF